MKKTYILLAILGFTTTIFAQTPVVNFFNQYVVRNANISILVRDLKTGEDVDSYRSNYATIPASTMKVISTATALELFGPDYKYVTKLEYDGTISSAGKLTGNIYITGSGDPTLGSDKLGDKNFLPTWSDVIKKAGIKSIQGKIIADESCFDLTGINPKWTWDDIGNYYAPGIYGISYLDNSLKVKFTSGAVGQLSKITSTDPEIPGMIIDNQVKGTTTKSDNAYFFGSPRTNYRYVTGEIPSNKTDFIVKADIPRPGALLALHLKNALNASGIDVLGISDTVPLSKLKRTILYKQISPALAEIISEANIKSNNHYAEYIFRLNGLKRNKVSTIQNSIAEISGFWESKELRTDQLFMVDGCGLSPNNAVSARFFVDVMDYMYKKSKYKDAFMKSLAIAGKTGSLSHFLENSALTGKVFGKSGTIDRVKCYTGYVITDSKELVFAVMVNNANGNSTQVQNEIEKFLLEVTK